MLGEQLIRNERIALIELIKNSYDADASWVKVNFSGFGENWELGDHSKIIIEDDGVGMDKDIIVNHLTNPATPEKKKRKQVKSQTPKGRFIQGEKGIGRFAILKLGRKIVFTTRAKKSNEEFVVDYDFLDYDDEFLEKNGKEKDIFLDQIELSYRSQAPAVNIKCDVTLGEETVTRDPHGTHIEIESLKGKWSAHKVEQVYRDVARLQSIFMPGRKPNAATKKTSKIASTDEFRVIICREGNEIEHQDHSELLAGFVQNNAVLKYEKGRFEQASNRFVFTRNGSEVVLDLADAKSKKSFKERFVESEKPLVLRQAECGDFEFGFYVFDFSKKAPPKYELTADEIKIIKEHRIYLYRDGIRVYPYGEEDDDWLGIDIHRGTVSAGDLLSNDQMFGFVNISHEKNPNLVDKTNREGLIENGRSFDDFKGLLKVLLSHIRSIDYKRYQASEQENTGAQTFAKQLTALNLKELRALAKDAKSFTSPKAHKLIDEVEKNYEAERSYLIQRAETTEELAGVGLSVETSSHDIMSMLDKSESRLDALIKEGLSGSIDSDSFAEELQVLRGQLGFVVSQMRDMQSMFRSSKQRRRRIRVIELVRNVEKIYKRVLKEKDVDLEINEIGSPLVAKTTDAVLLQLLINLLDNSLYWLSAQDDPGTGKILIQLNGHDGTLIFSDNGPGINPHDEPYIFEAFYSGKGEEGRGLGLYIARQLLRRHEYDIELASLKADKLQPGANFIISFITQE